MDKRASTRYTVSLNALVHPTVGRSWLCQIQDFCDAGMLLVEQNGRPRRSLPGISAGETVGIHFSVPTDSKDRHFRLEGKIVRVMDSGVGINFPEGMDELAFNTLSDHSGMEPVRQDPPSSAKTAKKSNADAKSSAAAEETLKEPEADFRASGLNPADTKKIVAMLRAETIKVIPEMTAAFFKYMDTELMELAKDAKSNAEQSEYFAAMSTLEKAKKQISDDFMNVIVSQIDKPRNLQALLAERKKASEERKAQSQKRIKLSLVNTEEFEDWLAVANIISRSERMYEKYLEEILPRMGLLVDSWSHNEANPLGTCVFTHAFDEAMQNVDISKDIRQRVYTGYENNVIPRFRPLYISATKLMEESGVFPDLDEDYVTPAPQPIKKAPEPEPEPETDSDVPLEEDSDDLDIDLGFDDEEPEPEPPRRRDREREKASSRRARRRRPEPEPEPEDDDDDLELGFDVLEDGFGENDVDDGYDEDDDYEDDFDDDYEEEPEPPPPPRSSRRRGASSRRRGGAQQAAAPQRRPAQRAQRRRRRTDDVGEAIRNIYNSVRDLIGAKGNYYDEDEDFEGDYNYFEGEEVEDLLGTLEAEMFEVAEQPGQRMPVRQRLMETASLVGGRKVSPEVMKNIEVVENLVDTIEEDEMLSPNTKDWVRQLELTLDKVAATEDDFLSERNPHRSMEVINQLAQLGGAESGSAKRAVDGIVSEINTEYDEDPEVFDRAAAKLRPLVERQNRAFNGNIQRTVKASEGQQTLLNAQRAVVSEMDQRYAGREVPEVLYRLLMPGWRNLLVNTHLRQGEDSADWQKHMRALDQVFQYLDDGSDPASSPDYMEPDELLGHIESGLDSISYEPGQRIPLINSLRQVFSGQVAPEELPRVALKENTIAENLGFEDVTRQDETRRKIREERSDDSSWQKALERAQRLHLGEWVEFSEAKQGQEISIVAWVNGDASRFVFVNKRGVKTHDLAVEELANMIEQGLVRIMEESDIPLTDRASHRMLQNMHNQLTHQASHDDLTGLLNRKEFERQLESALETAKRQELMHLCAYLDLDQFKVINNTGGHAAGDKLLVTIAGLLRDKLDAHEAQIARLGGDEFGVLLLDCDQEKGNVLLKFIADAVKALRFEWEQDTFSLTTSCGLYYVDKDTESVSKIMSGADSACIAAKEAGRDRIHEYKMDDTDMEYRKDIMEFVSHIDRALDQNRFELNCQKIQSIDEDDVHYEILLTVLDADDNPLPPQDFIIAAERYNRMGAVDRWVVRNSFDFIAANILELEDIGHFSINISGNSLTEPDFMDYILEQFNRTRLPTSKIVFEITETSAIGNLDDVVEFMEKMKIIGVQFSLDDFGTGLSSYSYLRTLPVDYLKIDGIFVKDIKDNPSDYAVVKSINEIGHFMGKKTIAEYVEDEEIIEILREIGVDYAQGWGVGKKFPVRELLDSL